MLKMDQIIQIRILSGHPNLFRDSLIGKISDSDSEDSRIVAWSRSHLILNRLLFKMRFSATGKLVYRPRTHLRDSKKWVVLMCEDELSNYYRHLYHREFFYRPKLTRAVWGAHVSLVRGEKAPNQEAWGFAANKFIKFEYEPGVKDNGEYLWLKVYSDELCAIREVLGLSREPKFGFHLTIGRFQNDN